MKLILRTAAAGIAVASFSVAPAASAATTASANATAEILTALSVTVDPGANVLNFGTIADGGITGNETVTVAPGAGFATCSSTLMVCAGTVATPSFDIVGAPNLNVQVSFANLTEPLTNGGGNTMDASSFVTDHADGGIQDQVLLDGAGSNSFAVGGVLTVQPGQAPGVYNGTLTVSVAYN